MPRNAVELHCDESERAKVVALATSRAAEARLVQRTRAILCLLGLRRK